MRRGARLRLIAALTLLTAPAPAYARQADGDYPQGQGQEALIAWLEGRTNIAPASVVSVTPELVVALAGKTLPSTSGGPLRLTLREEVIAASYAPTVGGRSSLMSLEIHCEERRVRMDERRLYPGPNLSGLPQVSGPSAAWVRIPDDSIMDDVARAACGPDYRWPLRTVAVEPPTPDVVFEPEPVVADRQPEISLVSAPAMLPGVEPALPEGPVFAVQIGAYDSAELAEAAWRKLSAERPVLVEGLGFETRPVRVRGRDYLRGLVRDFKSPEETAAFCTAIAGTDYGCIIRPL